MKLIILGAGGYGRMIADIACQSDRFKSIHFLDDNQSGADILGKCENFQDFMAPGSCMYPAFGNNEIRLQWLEKLAKLGIPIPGFIHSTAYVSPTAVLDVGVVVLPHAVINTGCKVCMGCLINSGAIVDHNCVLEDGVHICIGGLVKAENRIPRCMKIEAGQVISNRQYPL